MKIFENLEELKTFLPRLTILDFNNIREFTISAAHINVIPFLGKALFENILKSENSELKEQLKRVIAYYTMFNYVQAASINVSEAGVQQMQTQNSFASSYVNKMQALNFYADSADNALEQLFQMLESSDLDKAKAILELEKILFTSAEDFSKVFNISNKFKSFFALKTSLEDTTERKIIPIIGIETFEKVLNFIHKKSEQTDKNIPEIAQKCRFIVANLAVSRSLPFLSIKFRDAAISVASFYSPPPAELNLINLRLEDIKKECEKCATTYLIDLEKLVKGSQNSMIENDKNNKYYIAQW